MLIQFRNARVPVIINKEHITHVSASFVDGSEDAKISDEGAFVHITGGDAIYVCGTLQDVCKSIQLGVPQGTCK